MYSAAMNKWTVWASHREIEPWLSNVTDEGRIQVLSDFIVHGFQHLALAGRYEKHQLSTRSKKSGTSLLRKCSYPHVRMLLKGITRLDTPPRHKAPMIPSPKLAGGGVGCVVFFFLLRRSEIVFISGNLFKRFALRAEDLVVLDISGVPTLSAAAAHEISRFQDQSVRTFHRSSVVSIRARFRVSSFRGSASSKTKTRPSSRNPSGGIPGADRPVGVYFNDIPVECNQEGCRTKWRRFSPHPFRAGGATHMRRAGVDAMTIQYTFKTYTNHFRESITSLVANMVTSSKGDSTLH
ncbi:hypothetical protein PHMEG_00029693 [Phytophthora megakarya]|uniref:Uncharacterized protein n=1 Tax=Phytophthora megakarya TaxID=4795 RepID=A0A225V2Y0_9STRA|nr:hypothetical protein PHMEG_00029693 [Phytophthora megakarya]